jgi:hypothetical protein
MLLVGTIALIMFLVVLSQGQFDLTSLLVAAGLLGLGVLLRQWSRRRKIRPPTRGRMLRRLMRRQREEDLLGE